MVVVNGILTSYYPPKNGIAKIHKMEFKAVRGDLMRFSDIIKKQIKPTETEFNRPKANLSKISIFIGFFKKKASSESESVQKFEPGCPEIQILHRFFVALPMVFE